MGPGLPESGREIRLDNIEALKVEPYNDQHFGDIMGPLVLGTGCDAAKRQAAEFVCHIIETRTPEALEEVFSDIVTLKREGERVKAGMIQRNASAYRAYHIFIEETGREPSKCELRKFIVARSQEFGGDFPKDEDGKAWARIWETIGLKALPDGGGTKSR